MQAHPLADKFPMLADADMELLANDIRDNGLLHPIITWKGTIIDGRNRLKACEIADITPLFAEGDFASEHDVKAFIISMNIRRRHLNPGQLAMLGEELRSGFEAEAKERQLAAGKENAAAGANARWGKGDALGLNSGQGHAKSDNEQSGKVNAKIAKAVGVGRDTVRVAQQVKQAAPELADKVVSGEMTLNAAHNQVKPKKPKATKKPDEKQIQVSVNVRPEDWEQYKDQATKEGTSAAAKLGAVVADPEIDPKALPMSAQEKLEAAIRQEKRKLQAEFEQAVQDELKRALNDMVLPQYNKKLVEYQQVIKARKGVMSRATYRMILSWLHPDRITDPGQKEGITKAFHAFTNLELVLCNEKEMPTSPASIPRNAEEWAKRRSETKTKRKMQSNNSVQQRR